jgi:hypothetical protein
LPHEIDSEVLLKSIKEEDFKTDAWKTIIRELKVKHAGSPGGIAEWIQSINATIGQYFYGAIMGMLLPPEGHTEEDAERDAGAITALFLEFIVFVSALDVAATAISATLVRNLIHTFRLFAATFGFDRYMDAVVAPGLSSSIIPALSHVYGERYQLQIPPIQDLIRFAVRESFYPEYVEEYGLRDEYPTELSQWGKKQGYSEDWLNHYWQSHWELPSIQIGFEMLHRRIITPEQLDKLFMAVDIMPWWRDKLQQVSHHVYTRVDVRRMRDMAVISREDCKQNYLDLGYDEEHAEKMTIWTEVYNAYPDLMARFVKGWLDIDEVRSELAALGVPEDRVEEMIQTKVKANAPDRLAKERDVTKSEIIKGVKQGVISRGEAEDLLQDMGYDESEAWYILQINIPPEEVEEEESARELSKTDILNGLKQELITSEDALALLVSIRYTEQDAQFILSIYEAAASGTLEGPQRSLTRADILKAVKTGLISPEQGFMMLLDIGYQEEDAAFILETHVEGTRNSPSSLQDFKVLTVGYRKAIGKGGNLPTEELREAERAYRGAKARLRALQRRQAGEIETGEAALTLNDAEYRYTLKLQEWEGQAGVSMDGTEY